MDLVDLPPGDARWSVALPVLRELRPHLTAESFAALHAEAAREGLVYLAAMEGDACLGVAGYRPLTKTHTGRELYVDDLVVTAGSRSGRVGAALLEEIAARGRAGGADTLALDSGVQRFGAHRFYLRERFDITSHHFVRSLR